MNIEIDFARADYLLHVISSLVAMIDEKVLHRPDLVRLLPLIPGILRVELWADQYAFANAFDESFLEADHFFSFLDHIVTGRECRNLQPKAVNGEEVRALRRHPILTRVTDFEQVLLEDDTPCVKLPI